MMENDNKEISTHQLNDIEEFFPKNNIELINKNIATNDPKTIHDKIEKYEELDSEQRYSHTHSDAQSSATFPSSSTNSATNPSPC